MTEFSFITGKKEDIKIDNIESLIELQTLYRQEQLPFQAPTFEFYKQVWNSPGLEEEEEFWAVAVDEQNIAVGYGAIYWAVKYENTDKASLSLYVRKEERRKGLGTKLHKLLIENLPSQIEKTTMSTFTTTEGLAYLNRFGRKHSYEELLLYVDLEKTDAGKIGKIATEQRKKVLDLGYEIKFVEGLDFEAQIDYLKYINLVERIWNDMPIEELSVDEYSLTKERYEEYCNYMLSFDARLLTLVIIHKETNSPIGYSNVFLNNHQNLVVKQEDTGILHKHRGNGLGYALKMILFNKILTDTKTKIWFTTNAASNEHMIRINKELDHVNFGSYLVFEFKREEWSELLK